jgi:hypothetical protein
VGDCKIVAMWLGRIVLALLYAQSMPECCKPDWDA